MKSVTLKITNCQDCPHHKNHQSLPTGDSFDMCDEDTVCTHPDIIAKGYTNDGWGEKVKGRCITGSNRPWQIRKGCEPVPKWCPLVKTRKPKEKSS